MYVFVSIHTQLDSPVLLFTPHTTFTTIDNYTMQNEHYPSQLHLWLFVLRTVTRLAFQPPTEEEVDFLPALPDRVWRHDYTIRNGFLREKRFAIESFSDNENGLEVLHNGVLLSSRLRAMTQPRVRDDRENET